MTLGEPMPNWIWTCDALRPPTIGSVFAEHGSCTQFSLLHAVGRVVRRAAAIQHHLDEAVFRDALRDAEEIRGKMLRVRVRRQIIARALRLEEYPHVLGRRVFQIKDLIKLCVVLLIQTGGVHQPRRSDREGSEHLGRLQERQRERDGIDLRGARADVRVQGCRSSRRRERRRCFRLNRQRTTSAKRRSA